MALYEESFDLASREPNHQLLQELDGAFLPTSCFYAWIESDELLGFVRWVQLAQTGVRFVIHIAVLPSAKGRGIGSALLSAVAEAGLPLLMEVACPENAKSPEEEEEAVRRLAFFGRLGGSILTSTYTQPALHANTNPVPLNLVLTRIDLVADPAALVQSFYKEIWGLKADHIFVHRALQGLKSNHLPG